MRVASSIPSKYLYAHAPPADRCPTRRVGGRRAAGGVWCGWSIQWADPNLDANRSAGDPDPEPTPDAVPTLDAGATSRANPDSRADVGPGAEPIPAPEPTPDPEPTLESTPAPEPTPSGERGKVLRVIDGDTIEIRYLSGGEAVVGHIENVRYLGIDTPETWEPGGAEATEFNRERVEGQTVRLVRAGRNRDNFGHLLRHVFVVYQGQEIDLVAALIAAGHVKGLAAAPTTPATMETPSPRIADGLQGAWALFAVTNIGQKLIRDEPNTSAVRIQWQDINDPNVFSVYTPSTNTISVKRSLRTESAAALAAVLAHDIWHAASPFPYPRDAQTCIQDEVLAYRTQARVWFELDSPTLSTALYRSHSRTAKASLVRIAEASRNRRGVAPYSPLQLGLDSLHSFMIYVMNVTAQIPTFQVCERATVSRQGPGRAHPGRGGRCRWQPVAQGHIP